MTFPIALVTFIVVSTIGHTLRRGTLALMDWALYRLGGEP